jgi:hypothetical protein
MFMCATSENGGRKVGGSSAAPNAHTVVKEEEVKQQPNLKSPVLSRKPFALLFN